MNHIDDPASVTSPNSDHETVEGEKPDTAFKVVTDPKLLPTTNKVSWLRYALSYSILFGIVISLVTAAHFGGLELFQTPFQIVAVSIAIVGLLLLNGTGEVDYWELVTEYWWLCMPIAAGAGLFYILMDRGAESVAEGLE